MGSVWFQNFYLYVLILPIVTVANNFARSYIVDKRYPQYKGKETLSKEDQKDIMSRVGALIGNKIGGAVFTSVDSIVISSFLGLDILGKYTNYYTIFAAVYAVFSTAYTAIQSTVGNSLVCKSIEENYQLFRKLFSGNAVLTCFSTCSFIFLYQPFMRLWVGPDNLLGIEIPFLLALYYYVRSTRRICFLFKEAAGMWRETWLMPYLSVVVNLTGNILMVKLLGLPGVVISSVLALVLVEIPWETSVFFKKFFCRKISPYLLDVLRSVLTTSIAIVIVAAASYVVDRYVTNDILLLVIRFALCLMATGGVCLSAVKKLKLKNLMLSIKK